MQKPVLAEHGPGLPHLAYVITATLGAAIAVILLALFAVGGDRHATGAPSAVVTH